MVPARGGSKGIVLKNLRPIHGAPLVTWAGRIVSQLPWVDRAVVSTDHKEIALVAQAAGLDAPFFRPEHLSGDRVSDWDVLSHSLLACEQIDETLYDVIVMLQPTSPGRLPDDVTMTVMALIQGGYDSVWTVSPTNLRHHPLKQLTFEDNRLNYFDPRGANMIARQQLEPVYHRNGVAYAIARECLLEQRSIMGANSSAVVIDRPLANIDTEDDLEEAQILMAQQIWWQKGN